MSSELHNYAANKERHNFSWQHLSRYVFLYFHLCYFKRGEHKGMAGDRQNLTSTLISMQIPHKQHKDKHKGKKEVPTDHFYLISLIHNYIPWSVSSFLMLPDSPGTFVSPIPVSEDCNK